VADNFCQLGLEDGCLGKQVSLGAVSLRMVEQLADSFHCGGDGEYPEVITAWICGNYEITWFLWVIGQHGRSHHHFTIYKRQLQLQARRVLSRHIKIPFLKLRIPIKVPNHKDGLQASQGDLEGLGGEFVHTGKIKEVSIRREILYEAPGDGSIGISGDDLRRFHFL